MWGYQKVEGTSPPPEVDIAAADELRSARKSHPEPELAGGVSGAGGALVGLQQRAGVLAGLLIFQSCSSFILSSYSSLLARHPVIVAFLTMLVGAGGNAGAPSPSPTPFPTPTPTPAP